MFREIRFYDKYTDAVTAPQWLFCALGLNFLLLGVLILIFPALLALSGSGILRRFGNHLASHREATLALQKALPALA